MNMLDLMKKNARTWDSLTTLYKSQLMTTTSGATLFDIIGRMLLSFEDGHADLYDPQTVQAADFYSQFVRQKPTNFLGLGLIQNRYLTESNQLNSKVLAGRIGSDIGYLRISSFYDANATFTVIDSILQKYSGLNGFIIDVRHNGGGQETNAITIASRFADVDQYTTYSYVKTRIGPNRTDFSDFTGHSIKPIGSIHYRKPVVVLTNRRTFSGAEYFTLMLRSRLKTQQVGDTTFGGVFTDPAQHILPNGWIYRTAKSILYDAQKRPITGGIVPDITVQITMADSLANKDAILEKAISLLKP